MSERLPEGHTACAYCGRALAAGERTRDHDVPVSRGGKGGRNVVPACRRCNGCKRDRTGAEFRAWLATYVGRDWLRAAR